LKKYPYVEAVSFNYGQRHKTELQAAKKIAKIAGVPHNVIDIKKAFLHLQSSALLDKTKKINVKSEKNENLPASFVPGRNILFLTLASMYAYEKDITTLVIGANQVDYSGYPDCRGCFIKSMNDALKNGLEFNIRIEAPLLNKNKKEIVLLAKELGVLNIIKKHTITCYNGVPSPGCGKCPACRIRRKGFEEAGEKEVV